MRKIIPIAILATLVLVGAGCSLASAPQVQIKPVTLEYWRVQDDPDTMSDQIAAYKKLHPNVDIVYRKMREEDYEKLLLEAFAENREPDIFSIPNVWIGGWKSKIMTMPKETTIPTQTVNAQKQIVTIKKKTPTMTILDMRNRYVEGVTKDVILPFVDTVDKPPVDKIVGIPLSADTLGLFYNKDILKKSSIEKPPETWRDLQEYAQKLTIFEEKKPDAPEGPPTDLKQSGAAIGLAKNVRNNVDILASIMSQNGAPMADPSYGYATFSNFPPEGSDGHAYPPGIEALIFYQSFSIPGSPNYSWNAQMPDSLDAFITGKTAFYFGYPSDIGQIRERAPKLDFGIAPLPQVDPSKAANLLHYPVEVVAKKTAHPDEAWDFLQFLASDEQVGPFLTAARRPTALRSLIQGQLTDPDIAPFAGQVLTASNWYKGRDYSKVVEAFAKMIETYPTAEHPEYYPIVAEAIGLINTTVGK